MKSAFVCGIKLINKKKKKKKKNEQYIYYSPFIRLFNWSCFMAWRFFNAKSCLYIHIRRTLFVNE